MYYCKDFHGLSVLSLYEGELLGRVDKLYFDKKLKKVCELEIINEEGLRLCLPTKNIYNVGKSAITVKNNTAVMFKEIDNEFCVAPIGSKVYSIVGEFLGVVQEFALSEKFLTEKVTLDNGNVLSVDKIASCGKNTVIFYNDEKKTNLKNFSPKLPKLFKKKNVEDISVPPEEQIVKTGVEEKYTLVQDSQFLIGRICTKDIFNFNNELLIKAHTRINKKNLKDISKFGKLKELMLYSVGEN